MVEPFFRDDRVTVYAESALAVLGDLPANSIDAVCTDPPYAIGLMRTSWDTFRSAARFQEWCTQWGEQCFRAIKPGGHVVAFGGTRTWHRLTSGLEDAGFEIRDSLAWLYGSGFPGTCIECGARFHVDDPIDRADDDEGLGARILRRHRPPRPRALPRVLAHHLRLRQGHLMLTLTDLFAGAGGSSTGAVQSGRVEVRMAANHWQRAVEVHNANHPDADHICADISQYDPRRVRKTDLLWASPECFAAGTLVLAERGLVPIEDVVVGDMVLTHKGRYRPVTHVLSRSADTIRLIGQGLTRGLEVTTEHPILTSLLGVTAWTKAADIGLSGRTRWATPTEHPAVNVPPIGGSRPIHVEDPRFAWLVGRWLGDGSLRVRDGKSSEAFITCGKHEAAELEQRLIWVHHDCGTCAPDLRWARRELRTAYVYANSHSEFAKWLLEHFGQHAHGKTVPAWAFGAPVEWRHALLDGYLSADGHDNGRGWQAASVSKNLALGVRLLAESLGHRVGLTYSHRDTWRIEGRAVRARPQWSVQWLHEIRRESSRTATEFDGKSWGTVKAIEPGNTGVTVYDITVKEDHSYVADGIVVHNCTNHSQAKGSKRPAQGIDLFGETLPDEAAERSRATMWDVVRFTEAHRYQAALVENVVEVVQWAPFRAWLLAMDSLGYNHSIVSCNSMHAQRHGLPAPQSRDRVYIGFWRKGNRAPDFEATQRPRAYCGRCDAVVESRQAWKNGRTVGRYRRQYVYVCPGCGSAVEPGYLPAAAAIDWTLPGQRIGDRAKPLADKTRARIAAGIARYWRPFTLEAAGNTYDAADPRHRAHGDPRVAGWRSADHPAHHREQGAGRARRGARGQGGAAHVRGAAHDDHTPRNRTRGSTFHRRATRRRVGGPVRRERAGDDHSSRYPPRARDPLLRRERHGISHRAPPRHRDNRRQAWTRRAVWWHLE